MFKGSLFGKSIITVFLFCLCEVGLLFGQVNSNEVVNKQHYQSLDYRQIGPFRGGRVTAVEGISTKPSTYYMGTTGGGVWKTTDSGKKWENITDGFLNVGSVGAVTVAPSDDNVIYVGTGSACPRGNISMGDGMYKSTDAGKSWQHIGLPEAGLIGDVIVDPNDSDRIYVAALGDIFGPNEQRGVFRSEDGGETWKKVLFASDSTGAVDLAINPSNPRIMYAAMWRAERKPWTLIDGGPEGGVWKTVDGGDTWEKLNKGLPSGTLGRIGVAVSPADPDRVWVLLEGDEEKEGGLYRSEDAGQSFERINRSHKLRSRAWYYMHVHADPQDSETVYISNAGFYKSTNGGEDFKEVETPHGDNHDLWINPHDNRKMINGNDGGANVSKNGGQSWSTQRNQPTAEFYRATVDDQFPYRVYGAQQDNSTISVPSWNPGDITPKQHWYSVGGGESGHIAVKPDNPDVIFAGNYIGTITRLNRETGHQRNVVAYPQLHDGMAPRDMKYRYQWNAPIRISPHDSDVLYHASQYVHRSTNEGQSWEKISPDLTTNANEYQDIPGGPIQHDHTGVEVYTTIFSFEESPLEEGVLWAGTDDGLVHLSKNDGETWEEITPNSMPEEGTVNTIDLSHHKDGRAYMAVYKYRENDNTPYIFRTENYGQDWELLTGSQNGIPDDHFVRAVREDPHNENILYAGTEFGMYISFDRGGHWQSFQQNLPKTPITDLQVHRDDLVVATQGRSFWIMDDISVLQELENEPITNTPYLFTPVNGLRTQLGEFGGHGVPESPSPGAKIYYNLNGEPDSLSIEILDENKQTIKTFKQEQHENVTANTGLNRFVWDMKYPAPDVVDDAVMSLSYTGGPKAPTGTYSVRLTVDGDTYEKPFSIEKDRRWDDITDSDLQAQFDLAIKVRDELTKVNSVIRGIRSARKQLKNTANLIAEAEYEINSQSSVDSLIKDLTELEEELIQTKNESSQDPINYPPQLDNQLAYLYTVVNGQDARPTEGSYERFKDVKTQLQPHYDQFSELKKEIAKYNTHLDKADIPSVIISPKL
ncbi:WD40/YVTN/BNR-like repeat-containing protein [Fodinibius sp. AD559]|uniref:WD40/YVTN/BNR-like repeat-containing protein n=1 Tax=Fodinibius sp. AD559 TaxID=3424179 RepID=UPI004046FB8B